MSVIPLSRGEKQLFCLARALLRRKTGSIVALDEATSAVDRGTDEKIRKILEEEFKDYTVIIVAHRLSSIEDCDTVVVLDRGRCVEVGNRGS